MSKRETIAKNKFEDYKRSSNRSLYDCYESCSKAKREAWESCKRLMNEKGGYDLKVVSSSKHIFTAGFMFEDSGVTKFMYITPSYNIVIEV